MNGLSFSTPSAFVPIGMSLLALALLLVHAGLFGIVRQADEGAAAHIFQGLLVLQIPIVAWLALRWGRRSPRRAWPIVGLQLLAWLAAAAAAFVLT